MLDPQYGIALFTDGSASYRDQSGGWAWVALDALEGSLSESGHEGDTTISRMELYAPAHGLFALHNQLGPCQVIVYSDSEYVVKGATDRNRKRKANGRLWRRLDDAIARHAYVEFKHVKGHSGQRFNELADELAGTARKAGLEARAKECT